MKTSTAVILLGLAPTLLVMSVSAEELVSCGYHDLPLGMEQMPEGSNTYSENESAMFFLYNMYMDVYRQAPDDGSWGKNGENEFGGFPSDSSLHKQWGFHWNGYLAMAVTSFSCTCCEINEVDVIFNPDYSWTFDRDVAAQDSTKVYYHSVLLHELGHSWGMQRPSSVEDYAYEHPTVMHAYVSGVIQDYMTIHWPEAYLMRRTYDDQTSIPTLRNMVVVSKYAHPTDLTWRKSTTVPDLHVYAGNTIDVRNLTVENTGTEDLSNVHVRLYLEQQGGYPWLIGDWVWATFPAETYGVYDFLGMQVPPTAPTGTYRATAHITVNGYEGDDFGFDSRTDFFDTIEVSGRTIEITSPVKQDEWFVGDDHTITWDSENAGSQVRIRYSYDLGATWHVIVESVPNTGSYVWTVPGPPDNSVWIEVSSVLYDVSGMSEYFRILGRSLEITQPNGGEDLTVGSYTTIQWSSYDSGDTVRLFYRCGATTEWQPITASAITDVGFYSWLLPAVSSVQCLVKVASETYSGVEDASDGFFSITDAAIEIASPQAGDAWYTGDLARVEFTYNGGCSVVGFELSRDGGATWSSLGTAFVDESPFLWVITGPDSPQARIKVYDACNSNAFALSGTFQIATRSVEITSPNGGEVWPAGEVRNITWDAVGAGDTVQLSFSRDLGQTDFSFIDTSAPNTGSYAWTVPPEFAGATARVKITGTSVGGLHDWSDADFTIFNPNIRVNYPNGGETLIGGESTVIRWKSSSAGDFVRIDYFLLRSKIPHPIVASTSNDGSFTWIVPTTLVGQQAFVRVTSVEYPATLDGSDGAFAVGQRDLTLTTPVGGEVFVPGASMTVTWTAENAGSTVRLTESCSEGATGRVLATSVVNNGLFEALVEPPRRSGCRIRIESLAHRTLFDFTDGTHGVANSAPIAGDDPVDIWPTGSSLVPVLVNDLDADGDPLSIISVSTPAKGTATHDGSTVRYTPDPRFTGEDSFVYEVADGHGGSDSATVQLKVVEGGIFGNGFESGDASGWAASVP